MYYVATQAPNPRPSAQLMPVQLHQWPLPAPAKRYLRRSLAFHPPLLPLPKRRLLSPARHSTAQHSISLHSQSKSSQPALNTYLQGALPGLASVAQSPFFFAFLFFFLLQLRTCCPGPLPSSSVRRLSSSLHPLAPARSPFTATPTLPSSHTNNSCTSTRNWLSRKESSHLRLPAAARNSRLLATLNEPRFRREELDQPPSTSVRSGASFAHLPLRLVPDLVRPSAPSANLRTWPLCRHP